MNTNLILLDYIGGLIDWAHHDNNAHLSLSETASMAKAVKKAQDMTNAG
jgi:alkaline phosphatase